MDFTTNPPQLSTQSLLPGNTYEDHANDLSHFSDFETWPNAVDKMKKPLVNITLPGLFEVPTSGSQGVQFVDSTSMDDSRKMQMGALKRDSQSPDPTSNKMVLGRKIKRVLESDDAGSEEWNVGHRARPPVSSSLDSEDSKPGRRTKNKPSVVSKKSANRTFSLRDPQFLGQGRGRGRPARSFFVADTSSARSNFHRIRGSNRMNGTIKSLAESLAIAERQTGQQCMPHQGTLPNSRDTDEVPATEGGCLSEFDMIGNGDVASSSRFPSSTVEPSLPQQSVERNSRIQLQNSRNLPDTSRASRQRPLGRARTPNERPNLAALQPDIYDAEDSSEVEYFTANSYSNNESNTEPLRSFNIFRPASEPEVRSNLSINVSSSEDEISVVYTSGPQTRSPHSRTGEPRRRARTFGGRYNRGSRRSSLPQSPGVSLRPDPVGQVRQVDEDERSARVLQSQAEVVESPPVSRPHSSFNSCQIHYCHQPCEREREREATSSVGMEASTIESTRERTRRYNQMVRRNTILLQDNSYGFFLVLMQLRDQLTRGLQTSQINRLPTRKYARFDGASSSSELPHMRADLNKECLICLNDYVEGDVLRYLPCFHEFHTLCIDPWLKMNRTCPVCRVVVDLDE